MSEHKRPTATCIKCDIPLADCHCPLASPATAAQLRALHSCPCHRHPSTHAPAGPDGASSCPLCGLGDALDDAPGWLDHVSAGLHEYNRPEPVECPACRGVYCAGHGTM